MSGAAPSTIRPKYVALDTSTWINLFKRRTDPEVKDILDALNSGQIIPYVCYDHVLELLQYDDQSIREQQLDFFGEIQLVGFPDHFPSPPWRNSPICASYLDVQESEISALLETPNLGLDQVLERARPPCRCWALRWTRHSRRLTRREYALEHRAPAVASA